MIAHFFSAKLLITFQGVSFRHQAKALLPEGLHNRSWREELIAIAKYFCCVLPVNLDVDSPDLGDDFGQQEVCSNVLILRTLP